MTKTEILKILEKYSDNDEVKLPYRHAYKAEDELLNLLPFVKENRDSLINFIDLHTRLENAKSYLEIFEMRVEQNNSLYEISNKYGVTRERVRQRINRFVKAVEQFKLYEEPAAFVTFEDERVYELGIEKLDLIYRSYNTLRKNGICSIGEIVNIGIKGVYKLKGIGKISASEIIEKTKDFVYGPEEPRTISLDSEIWELDLSYGYCSPLYRAGIRTIRDFMQAEVEHIKTLNGVGNKRIEGLIKERDRIKSELNFGREEPR